MARSMALRAASLAAVLAPCGADAGLRGSRGNESVTALAEQGVARGTFVLHKRFNLSAPPQEEFDVVVIPDADLTHSCSNYIDDGSTVFSREDKLVLKVASHCEGGGCMNSGRVMSKESFKYGLFTFSAKVPKCNHIWPALWLLPNNTHGEGNYGRWPCSGEIDVLETVHDISFGNFNLVAGYGSSGGCAPSAETLCNRCVPDYCTSTTMNPMSSHDRYFVEEVDCSQGSASWEEHLFVLDWQPERLSIWIDPTLSYDASGHLVQVTPKPAPANSKGMPTWKTYHRHSTPTWAAVGNFMEKCFPDQAAAGAPFDDSFKIVMNIAVGGYGGAPCTWGSNTCQSTCGGAVGSELIISDISVWEAML
mmetsp:Transcript_65915/g.190159  ORF Transcript_65915/g.190159 Transcript_65915/m.190159 type:complete len:364 (+) Transcript_65915:82-1173(+)